MDYILVAAFQFVGILFKALATTVELKKKYPEERLWGIVKVYWKEDWNAILASILILLTTLLLQYTIRYALGAEGELDGWKLVSVMLVSLILGYSGHQYVYKWLGTAGQALDKKVNDKLQS